MRWHAMPCTWKQLPIYCFASVEHRIESGSQAASMCTQYKTQGCVAWYRKVNLERPSAKLRHQYWQHSYCQQVQGDFIAMACVVRRIIEIEKEAIDSICSCSYPSAPATRLWTFKSRLALWLQSWLPSCQCAGWLTEQLSQCRSCRCWQYICGIAPASRSKKSAYCCLTGTRRHLLCKAQLMYYQCAQVKAQSPPYCLRVPLRQAQSSVSESHNSGFAILRAVGPLVGRWQASRASK